MRKASTVHCPAGKALIAWMAERRIRDCQLAGVIGVNGALFSHWLRGTSTPRVHHAVAIDRLTSGAVPVSAWCSESDIARMTSGLDELGATP